MDAFTDALNAKRHARIGARLDKICAESNRRIICIPAHTKDTSYHGLGRPWPNSLLVVANSNETECYQGGLGSLVAHVNAQGEAVVRPEWRLCGKRNQIMVLPLPDLRWQVRV
jgi:hypothetical protein